MPRLSTTTFVAPYWHGLLFRGLWVLLLASANISGAWAQSPWPDDDAGVEPDAAILQDHQVTSEQPPAAPPPPAVSNPDAGSSGTPFFSYSRALVWAGTAAAIYILALALFAGLLKRDWTPAGSLFFSLFFFGLIAWVGLTWYFRQQGLYVDGQPIPWWKQGDAWLSSLLPFALMCVLGLAIWLSRPPQPSLNMNTGDR